MANNLTPLGQLFVDQYSKSSLQEIASSMSDHAILLRQDEYQDLSTEERIRSDATFRLADAFEQIAFLLNFHVIPHIRS